MNEMRALMDGHKTCLLFKHVFLEQIPDDNRLILADDFKEPRQLAAQADMMWQAKQHCKSTINNVAAMSQLFAQTTCAYADRTTVTLPVNATIKDKWCYNY